MGWRVVVLRWRGNARLLDVRLRWLRRLIVEQISMHTRDFCLTGRVRG
jgi:hypothetical protein